MKKLLLPMMAFAIIMLPAAANAVQCRNTETGKFAKCGSPGSVLASQYVAKTKFKSKTAARMTAMPAATPTKPGFMSMLKPRAKPAATTMTMPMTKPMGKPMSKAVRCQSMTGKFVKCSAPGAKPI